MASLIRTPVAIHNEWLDAIEKIVDASTVGAVVDLLAEVCSAKADHIRANWQDEQTAAVWDLMAGELLETEQRLLKLKA